MSIDTVAARIGEIQSRIAELSEKAAPPVLSKLPTVSGTNGGMALIGGAKPFDVALAQATGKASLRPTGTLDPKLESLITKYGALNNVDTNLIRAVIIAESDGKTDCVSRKGAKGLMQLMPDEVKEYGISDPFDPEQNISAGTRQLAAKLKLYNNDLPLTLAAYNAGTGKVRAYNGIPPFEETRKYIDKVFSLMGKR
jgi:soluble lytic murein transglycosylase-like protein